MTEFVRFPRTPHLVTLDPLDVRDDKVMSPQAAAAFLEDDLVVEEKVDGLNLGLSVLEDRVVAQTRGSYIDPEDSRFGSLASWLRPRESRLSDALGQDLVVFGEWCALRHSIRYDALPDWFLVFDVYDRRQHRYWSLDERDLLTEALNLDRVPRIAAGRFDLAALEPMLGPSRLGGAPMEGLVLRHARHADDRAKLVRPGFVQSIAEHWRARPPDPNQLAIPCRY